MFSIRRSTFGPPSKLHDQIGGNDQAAADDQARRQPFILVIETRRLRDQRGKKQGERRIQNAKRL